MDIVNSNYYKTKPIDARKGYNNLYTIHYY